MMGQAIAGLWILFLQRSPGSIPGLGTGESPLTVSALCTTRDNIAVTHGNVNAVPSLNTLQLAIICGV